MQRPFFRRAICVHTHFGNFFTFKIFSPPHYYLQIKISHWMMIIVKNNKKAMPEIKIFFYRYLSQFFIFDTVAQLFRLNSTIHGKDCKHPFFVTQICHQESSLQPHPICRQYHIRPTGSAIGNQSDPRHSC